MANCMAPGPRIWDRTAPGFDGLPPAGTFQKRGGWKLPVEWTDLKYEVRSAKYAVQIIKKATKCLFCIKFFIALFSDNGYFIKRQGSSHQWLRLR